ncbi:MAG TPA: chemotaxis protein CheB [Vicinamibacterales bacterium]|jgi:two-component system, chemotaxis family, CheB/CheR fusion protein|nr:chemotaxis protein CheB [Vicinamibacterales bacterium]
MTKKSSKTPRTRKPPRPTRRARRPAEATQASARVPPASASKASKASDFAIVGVGASAGGLEAFTGLLRALAPDPGIAIVFVQHLAPQHESALVDLLSAHTTMPVVQVTEGLLVERNHVYVIPPNTQLLISGLELRIGPRPTDRSQYTPIDAFFSSLAMSGRRSIGVVLSGTASDGSIGINKIKEAGGITIAQSPDSAKYDGMPRAAIATGAIDLVLTPEEIGAKLSHLATRTARVDPVHVSPPDLEITDEQLEEIFDVLRPACGIDFRHYKLPTIKRRLFRRLTLRRLRDVDDYIRLLRSDGTEVRNLYRDLLIHVTRFFREPESFEAIARDVFPALVERRLRDRPLRVWVSGCATGEEAYSVAILLVEFLARQRADVRVQIFATDVSEGAIEHARTGVYQQAIETDVTPDRLRRFFSKHDGGYRVTKMIRDMCIFARQDLTKDPPFSRLDLILCRNVLIYMDLPLQKKLLSVFHYALNPNGFLVLGQAETVGAQATLFSLVDKKYRVHRKRPNAAAPAAAFPVDHTALRATVKKAPADLPTVERVLQTEVNRVINDRYAPPAVVIDADMQIVQFRGQTGAFLEPAPGQASLSLLKMAKEGLLYGLRSAVTAARKSRSTVRRSGLRVRSGKRWLRVDLEVIPLASPSRIHYLVLFDQHGLRVVQPSQDVSASAEAGKRGKSQVHSLQRELAASREYLQSVIQELEAANGELQSANEEILSSNEELQSTNEELDTAKEELQSTNEELNTVNEELQGRNDELSRVNGDLLNLLASVQIAIVIVGSDMRIRRFTPMAERVLNLIPGDVDRFIGHINPNIEGASLEQLIAECIDTISMVEREVQDRQGRWYALRVRPYRSLDNKIDGAVLALFDIDAPKRYEASVRSATALAQTILRGSPAAMALVDSAWRIVSANEKFVELLRLRGDGIEGRLLTENVRLVSGVDQFEAAIGSEGEPLSQFDLTVRPAEQSSPIALNAHVFPAYDGSSGRLVLLTDGTLAGDVAESS